MITLHDTADQPKAFMQNFMKIVQHVEPYM